MAQFSIRQSLRFAFTAYAKHWMVVLAASILLGLSGYAARAVPRMVAQRMGVYQEVVDDQQMDAGQSVMQRVNLAVAKMSAHLENTPKQYLFLLLLVLFICWLVNVFFMCGLARVALRIKDKNAATVAAIFEDKKVVFRALGVMVIVALYALCMLVGIAVLSIPVVLLLKSVLGAGMLRMMMGFTGAVVIAVAFGFWLVGYLFAFFCVVDKPKTGVRAAIAMGQTVVSGIRLKLMGALFIVGLILIPLALLVRNLLMMGGVHDMLMQKMVIGIILMPVSYLYLVFMYRGLSSK